jgi:hypothetical protein
MARSAGILAFTALRSDRSRKVSLSKNIALAQANSDDAAMLGQNKRNACFTLARQPDRRRLRILYKSAAKWQS